MKFRKTRDEKLKDLLGVDAQFVHLGIEVAHRVRDSLKRDPEDIEAAYNGIIGEMEKQERRLQIASLFDQLPPERRFAILTQYFDDDELRQALAEKRQAAIDRDNRANAIQELVRSVRLNHEVELSSIPAETQVRISLFSKGDFDYHYDKPSDMLSPRKYARVLTLTSMGESEFKFLNDKSDYHSGRPVPALKPHQVMSLGGARRPDFDFSPTLRVRDQLVCDIEGEQTVIGHSGAEGLRREFVGLIAVEGVELFGKNLD